MGIMEIGTKALQASQVALQTAGNNIANVNTEGYSRQRAILVPVAGQYTGGGYIGKGVSVQTIQRNFSAFLNRQATIANSTEASDSTRAAKLKQLEGIFEGGSNGLGAAISDMLNSFSDVASSPTDLTARTVVLTRVDETAARMRSTAQRLEELQAGVTQELRQKVETVNSLAVSISEVNEEIARAQGNGQPPNDLLDRRDQLIRELSSYVQTTTIPADDGTLGVFIGGSQALVLGGRVSKVSIEKDDFADPFRVKLAIDREGSKVLLDENTLAGGEVSGLLRFQNTDLIEGRNLLGRLTLGISSSINDQHKLGIDLDGNPGGNLLTPAGFSNANVLEPQKPATLNVGTMTGPQAPTMTILDNTKLVASDYEMVFGAAGSFTITRRSDGKVFTQADVTPPAVPASASADVFASLDGLEIHNPFAAAAGNGDRYLFKPFSTSAAAISTQFSTPRALAIGNPVSAASGVSNTGSLQLISIKARTNPPVNIPVTLTFLDSFTYTRSDDPSATPQPYQAGQVIEGTIPVTNPLSEWALKLQGTPQAGDTFVVLSNPYPSLSAGNATAIMDLRDVAMFDGAALTDGYAGLISQVGIRAQSANYAAAVSGTISSNLERDRASVSGVNLDEEAANLLRYQQSYQASAKMIQIAQSIFQSLIQGLT